MTDTTSAIPSPAEPVIDRNRRWTPVWYPWIKRLLETVKATTTSVFQIQTDVDQINGQWGISVNANNRVTAAIRLDGGVTETSFAVLADKFIVVHPAANGTTMTAFVVGLVDGVSTVGINGTLIVDGSIVARHLAVNTLDAISADVGELTAGVLRSADSKFIIDLDAKSITMST